jgi:hypothetical protein
LFHVVLPQNQQAHDENLESAELQGSHFALTHHLKTAESIPKLKDHAEAIEQTAARTF